MSKFIIEHDKNISNMLPAFYLQLKENEITAIYSDVDTQNALMDYIHKRKNIDVCTFSEGLYERLSVKSNIRFFHKWFQAEKPLSEVLVMFDLQAIEEKSVKNCSPSELQRIFYAKYYLSNLEWTIFYDPISSMNVQTINTFIKLLESLTKENRSALILVTSAEHALLLGDIAYRLGGNGIHLLETENEAQVNESPGTTSPVVEKLFKIPAKVDDKVILFDPTEIDYIESQSGKSYIYINQDAFALDLTLTEIEKKLELYGFYRCHRSYIVNLQKVREIITWSKNTYSLRINNKTQSTIPLSRTKLHVIQEIFKLK